MLCFLFGAWLAVSYCAPPPPAFLEYYETATLVRPRVERAIALVNDVMAVGDSSLRVVADWALEGAPPKKNEIIIFLMKSPASPPAKALQRRVMQQQVDRIKTNRTVIDEAFDHCTDIDDCVESLYPEGSSDLVLETLNRINSAEFGKTDPACRCMVLIEHDLRLQEIVFSASWDLYINVTWFDSADQFQAALDADKIPPALLDGEGLRPEALIAFIILHELGHISAREPEPLTERAETFVAGLNSEKQKELDADAFCRATPAAVFYGASFRRTCSPLHNAGEPRYVDLCHRDKGKIERGSMSTVPRSASGVSELASSVRIVRNPLQPRGAEGRVDS